MINEFIMQTYRVDKDQGKIWHPPYKSVENFQSSQFRLENFCIPPKNPPPPQVIHNECSLSAAELIQNILWRLFQNLMEKTAHLKQNILYTVAVNSSD